MRYVRFKNLFDCHFYPGMIDHVPEGEPVSHELTVNAVFEAVHVPEGLVVSSMSRPPFEAETVGRCGGLIKALLQPFDSAGGQARMSVSPHAVVQWIPETGDEAFVDGELAVIVGIKSHSGEVSFRTLSAAGSCSFRARSCVLEGRKHSIVQNSKGKAVEPQTWDHFFSIEFVPVVAPVYGETFGGALEFLSLGSLKSCEVRCLADMYGKVVPVLGRDKVDFDIVDDGKIGFFRQHCGFRGRRSCKCVDDKGTPFLKAGKDYGADFLKLTGTVEDPGMIAVSGEFGTPGELTARAFKWTRFEGMGRKEKP